MLITKRFPVDLTVNEGERAVVAKISTAAVDRDDEVLLPAGCDASDYEANPVVFLQHNYWTLPVGKCVSLKRDTDAIITKTIFAERPKDFQGGEWVPDTLLSLYQQGVLNAFSVGFEPIEERKPTPGDIGKFGPTVERIFSKWKLMEYSCVSLPANQEAVALAVSKGYGAFAKSVFGYKAPDSTAKPGNYRAAPSGDNCSKCQQMKEGDGGAMSCQCPDMGDMNCDAAHVCDNFTAMPEPAKSAPAVIIPKRVLYVIQSAAPASIDIAKGVSDGIAKARGRVYAI